MNDDRLEALLSAYAAGTLTEAERDDLFAVAMERQDVFDRLLNEESLRETLSHPATRQRLMNVLHPSSRKRWFAWIKSPGWAVSAVLSVLIIAAVLVRVPLRRHPVPEPLNLPLKPPDLLARVEPPTPRRQSLPEPVRKRSVAGEPAAATAAPRTPRSARRSESAARDSVQVTAQAPALALEQSTNASRDVSPRGEAGSSAGFVDPNSPRAIYQSEQARQSAKALSRSSGVAGSVSFESNAKARIPPYSSNARQSRALRASFHTTGAPDDLDWRSPVPLGSFVRVNLTYPGYLGAIEHGPAGKRLVLDAGDRLLPPGSALNLPLGDATGALELTLIYSASPLTPDAIDLFLKSPAGPAEQTHSAAEHAAYAAASAAAPALVLTLPIQVRE